MPKNPTAGEIEKLTDEELVRLSVEDKENFYYFNLQECLLIHRH